SSDKDLMQLVRPTVSMYDPMKDRQIGIAEVIEKWGVPPEKMIDLQALTGDSIDNIPGVPGIGPKTAAQLLEEYGDLDTLLSRAHEIKQNKRRENLIEYAEKARISRELVRLKDDVPVELPLDALALNPPNGPKLIAFLKAMEFSSLTRRVAEATGTDAAAIEPAYVEVQKGAEAHGPDLTIPATGTGELGAEGEVAPERAEETETPEKLARKLAEAAVGKQFDRSRYVCIRDLEALNQWVAEARETGLLALTAETTSSDPMQAELCGIALATAPGRAAYVPLAHKDGSADLLGGGLVDGQLAIADVLGVLQPLLHDSAVLKIGQNLKYAWLLLYRHGIEIAPYDDTMLISYVLEAGGQAHGLDALSQRWLGTTPLSYTEAAKGRAKTTF